MIYEYRLLSIRPYIVDYFYYVSRLLDSVSEKIIEVLNQNAG